MSFKIAITGPESTAKSTLAVQLSMHYKCTLIVEYSRDYLHRYGPVYGPTDILKMAEIHNEKLMGTDGRKKTQIWDTDLLNYYIWYKVKYNESRQDLMELWHSNKADYYLLCLPDIPWYEDPLRENPLDRDHLFVQYLHLIQSHKLNYNIIAGTGQQRFMKSIWFIESQLQKKG